MSNSIAIIAPELYPVPAIRGGAFSIWTENLVQHLQSGHINVISATDGSLPSEERVGNVTFYRVKEDPFLSIVACFLDRLPLIGRRLGPRFHGMAYLSAFHKRLEGMDLIYVLNRPQFLRKIKASAPHAKLVLRLGNLHLQSPRQLKIADWIDCCSDFVASRVRSVIQRNERVGVTMEGIDCKLFRPCAEGERSELRRRFVPSHDGAIVLFVGRLVPEKGVQLLLDAAQLLQEREVDIKVLFAGNAYDKDYERRLRANAPSNVVFLGHRSQSEIADLMRMSDMFAGPSLWDEPAGRVFGESMASGTPVISTARGGIPETVASSQAGILLAPAPTTLDLAENIIMLASDNALRESLAISGRHWAESHLDWASIARDVDSMINDVRSLHGHADL